MDKNFKDVKEMYNKLRNIERQKIVEKLVEKGFKGNGHQGTWKYTS